MKQYHWVVVYDSEQGWRIEPVEEEVRYPNGTIYDTENNSWEYGYQGEGIFLDRECELTETLCAKLETMNGVK